MFRGATRLCCLLLIVLGAWTIAATGASAAYRYDMNGTWQCCGAGGAGAQTWIISGNQGTGESPGGGEFATIENSQNGPKVSIITTYVNSTYVATFLGQFSANGKSMSGTWTSNIGQSGTWTATRGTAHGPAPPPVTHSSTALPLASTLETPWAVFHSTGHNLVNAGVTIAVMLFITFPANIFNQTFSSNYGEIMLILARFRRRVRRILPGAHEEPPAAPAGAVTPTTAAPSGTGRTVFFLVLLVGALLGALLNPKFGLNRQTLAGVGATLVAFALGTALSWFVATRFRRFHHYQTATYLKALPLGLAVAALCVVISRASDFQPGYLYGIVVGVAFVESLADRHNAHLTVLSIATTLVVALLAWFAWIPVNHLVLTHGANVALAVLDDLLGSLFIGGLVGTVVSLLPLEFMPGGTLAKWRKDVWAIVFFVALFLLVEVELRPAAGATHPGHAPVVTAVVLFLFFGGATWWLRHFFAARATTVTATASTEPDAGASAS